MFERLVQLMRSNERLLAEQRALALRLRRARAYRAEPGCNPRLAEVNLTFVRVKYSGVLTRLRANRLEARGILAGLGPGRRFPHPFG